MTIEQKLLAVVNLILIGIFGLKLIVIEIDSFLTFLEKIVRKRKVRQGRKQR